MATSPTARIARQWAKNLNEDIPTIDRLGGAIMSEYEDSTSGDYCAARDITTWLETRNATKLSTCYNKAFTAVYFTIDGCECSISILRTLKLSMTLFCKYDGQKLPDVTYDMRKKDVAIQSLAALYFEQSPSAMIARPLDVRRASSGPSTSRKICVPSSMPPPPLITKRSSSAAKPTSRATDSPNWRQQSKDMFRDPKPVRNESRESEQVVAKAINVRDDIGRCGLDLVKLDNLALGPPAYGASYMSERNTGMP